MKRGDIYLVRIDPSATGELSGFGPVVVVSPAPFTQDSSLSIVLPITKGANITRKIKHGVTITGTETHGVIRCDQPRVLDLNAREGRKIDEVAPAQIDEALARLAALLG